MDKIVHERIAELTRRINELARQQTNMSNQLVQLINELEALKKSINEAEAVIPEQPVQVSIIEVNEVIEAPAYQRSATPVAENAQPVTTPPPVRLKKNTFEEFIGKNVASKVGILVTIIGIFIGARYAIEHRMVSETVRIISGYINGLALIGVAIWLKRKYEAYSSVLMGGGLAVLYFITYIAYGVYGRIPQEAAFALMLVFTAATVYASFLYNRVIIAHLALIGAYAIPFLLSDNSGRYAVFFGYIAIINTGILVVSFRKYWKSLFYSAFALTWVIYLTWYFFSYQHPKHVYIAWTYLCIFFLIFYCTFLAYKIIKKERYELDDVIILLANAFGFYGIGYGLLHKDVPSENYAGVFTLINAIIHLVVSQVIRKLQLADRALYYMILGLVIVFCTIAVPVQLDGNWVTLLWTAEAVLVFLIGRMRQAAAYEKLGAGLAILSFISLIHDWFNHSYEFTFPDGAPEHPFINIIFVSGLLVAAAQGAILFYNRNKKYQSELPAHSTYRSFYDYALPVIFFITTYFVFQIEINGYFNQLGKAARSYHDYFGMLGTEVTAFAFIVLLLYTMLFNGVIIVVNRRWVRNNMLARVSLAGIVSLILVLLIQGLAVVNELAVFYHQVKPAYFGAGDLFIRYVVIAFTAALLYTGNKVMRDFVPEPAWRNAWSLMVHTVILGFISAEYLCWTTLGGADNQYKLGLSIVWGVYALLLVVLGIRKKQKHLRLAAIALFSITLIKLFFYDLAGAQTITKTISFISLGVILLLVSYLYNRYKDVLFGDEEE
jgi:uncharacterized membrane protein